MKSKIIINIDFSQELLNSYQINRNAVIIQKNKQVVTKKSFNGINIVDYEIKFKKDKIFEDKFYQAFEDKDLLLSLIDINNKYEKTMKDIEQYNMEVTCLLGSNGRINRNEFVYNTTE